MPNNGNLGAAVNPTTSANTATEFEAKQHLYNSAIQRIDAEIKQIIDDLPDAVRYHVTSQNGSDISKMTVFEQTAMEPYASLISEVKLNLDSLRAKRKNLVAKYSEMEVELEKFLLNG